MKIEILLIGMAERKDFMANTENSRKTLGMCIRTEYITAK